MSDVTEAGDDGYQPVAADAVITVNHHDVAYAVFGLGAFIDYRRDDGMQDEDLYSFMEAYLNLQAVLLGRARPDHSSLRSRIASAGQTLSLDQASQVSPSWLPDDEKRRVLGL